MFAKRKFAILTIIAVLLFTFATTDSANAKGNEYDAVCNHLKKQYKAEKVKIPFMWLARAVVGVVRPAGVKSFKVTQFRNLKFSRDSLDKEMQAVMTNAFSDEWSPILRVRSRDGEQVYMNMRESGNNVKVLVVTIAENEAIVIRAKFNPDKLVAFMENPKIFGISLDDNRSEAKKEINEPEKDIIKPEKTEESEDTN